jgi:hypothetical protein
MVNYYNNLKKNITDVRQFSTLYMLQMYDKRRLGLGYKWAYGILPIDQRRRRGTKDEGVLCTGSVRKLLFL